MLRRAASRLGKRDTLRSTAMPEGVQPKEGGHGDHWGCVVRASEQDDLLRFIGEVVQSAERPEVFHARGAGLAVISRGERLHARILVVDDQLVTAYPEAEQGTIWPVTVSEIVSWANGVEGQITGTCQGAALSFFDTRFYANH